MNTNRLRNIIRHLILEDATHRCLGGEFVPLESPECFDDVCCRIEDATHARDNCHKGTASRSHYNGILKDLRQKRRQLIKLQISAVENI